MNYTIDIDMESSFAGVRKVAELTRQAVGDHIGVEQSYEIELALVEACTNAVRHGRSTKFRVRLRVADDSLELLVENEGEPFQLEGKQMPTFQEDEPETFPTGGMGVPLIRHIMDNVEYEATGGVNRLKMLKRISKVSAKEPQ